MNSRRRSHFHSAHVSGLTLLVLFLFIGDVAADLRIQPSQDPIAFELVNTASHPIVLQRWNLLGTIDSMDEMFSDLEPITVHTVKLVTQWESFGDSIRLIFSLTNEGDLTRRVRLALTSESSADELSTSRVPNGARIDVRGELRPLFVLAHDFSGIWIGARSLLTGNQWNHTINSSFHGTSVVLSWQGITLQRGQTVTRVLYFTFDQSHLRESLTEHSGLSFSEAEWPMDVFLKSEGVIRPAPEVSIVRRDREGLLSTDFDLLLKHSAEYNQTTVGVVIHFDLDCVITNFQGTVTLGNEVSSVIFHLPGITAVWAGPLDRQPSAAFRGNHMDFEYSGPNATLAFSWSELELLAGSAVHLGFSVEEAPLNRTNDVAGWVAPVLIIGLMLPNLIAILVSCLCRGTSAPLLTLFSSLALNAGYGCLILYYGLEDRDVFLGIPIGFGLWGLTLLFGALCDKNGPYVVCRQLRADVPNTTAVFSTIRTNRQLPPYITVTGTASHQESREVATEYESYQEPIYHLIVRERRRHDGSIERWTESVFSHYETRWRAIAEYFSEWERVTQGGGHFSRIPGAPGNRIERETQYRTVELWRQTNEYVYPSWQENGPPVRFPKADLLEITVECETTVDYDAEAQITQMRHQLAAEGQRHDTTVETFFSVSVPNLTKSIVGTLQDQKLAKTQQRYGGCCGFTIWILCLVTGYQTIFESIARFTTAELTVHCRKRVSGQSVLRAGHRQPDGAAAELAIEMPETNREPLLSAETSYTGFET